MRDARAIMGMPVVVEVLGEEALAQTGINAVYAYFREIDERFSTYKDMSEISRINRGEISPRENSAQMQEVFALAEKTKKESSGYFDIQRPDGTRDPSGIVKGWAINNAAQLLRARGISNFYIDAGGDIQTSGKNTIYNPHTPGQVLEDIVSITVIGRDVCEADRFATAAFAMGRSGAQFIESLRGLEAYMIDSAGTAVHTSGFEYYTR